MTTRLMKPGDLEAALQFRLSNSRAERSARQRARPRLEAPATRRRRGPSLLIGLVVSMTALFTLGTAMILANDALDAHLCDPADENATLIAQGFECTYLFNKGQGTDSDPVGELYVKRDADDNLILVTDLNTLPDTGHEQPKLCVDDDTDPINLSVTEPDNGAKSCVGATAGDTVNHADLILDPSLLKPAGDLPEEDAGKYEVMIDNLVEGTFGAFGSYTVFVNGYTEFSLHFNEGALSIESFFQAEAPGTKEGTKYNDLNANGIRDTGEPGLADWTIVAYNDVDSSGTLSAGDTLATSTTTDADGNYLLTLAPGDYVVCEVLETGWTQSEPANTICEADTIDNTLAPGGYAVTITSGSSETGNDFGNFTTGEKSGRKFEDLDADGTDDGGTDPGLGGWTINAYVDVDSDGDLSATEFAAGDVASDTTDPVDGSYLLSLDPGDYIVCEVLQAGWTQSYPTDAHVEAADCSAGTGLGPVGYAITIAPGDQQTDNDFGNFEQGVKSGTKFNDVNGDGDLTDGVPLAGWTINAYVDDNGDGILSATEFAAGAADSDVTNASGVYTLTLDPGDYIVCEVLQTGWTQTFPTAADSEAADCTTDSGATDLGPVGYAITIESGDELTGNDFGNFQLVLEGCTPGFWKQAHHLDSWAATGFSPSQTLESVFDVPDSLDLDNATLLEALSFRGGSDTTAAAQILFRAAVAALLNSAHPDIDFAFTTAEVIADVNAALATEDRATILELASELDAANNAGCPLS
jgi:hypothetical protein